MATMKRRQVIVDVKHETENVAYQERFTYLYSMCACGNIVKLSRERALHEYINGAAILDNDKLSANALPEQVVTVTDDR